MVTHELSDVVQEQLQGKTVFITGGTGGIGEQMVRFAAPHAAWVLFSYSSNKEKAIKLRDELGVDYVCLNLLIQESIDRRIWGMKQLFPDGADVIIANAGFEVSAPFDNTIYADIESPLLGKAAGNAYFLQQAVVEQAIVPHGSIGIVGSIAADGHGPQLGYAMANMALRAIPGTFADTEEGVDLGVVVVEPAFVDTPMAKNAIRALQLHLRKGLRYSKDEAEETINRMRQDNYIMTPQYAAARILEVTLDPSVQGVIQIPEGASLQRMRETYFVPKQN